MDTREEIIRGAARAHFVDAWANWQEQNGWPAGSPAGQNLMDMAPATTPILYDLDARKLVRAVEDHNGEYMARLYDATFPFDFSGAAPFYSSLNPEDFGHYLYMQAVGHGVGLFDYSELWGQNGEYDTPYWETIPYEPTRAGV